VPEQLVNVAKSLLTASHKRQGGDAAAPFTYALSQLQKNVEQLVSAGTSEGTSIRAKIVETHVSEFLEGEEVTSLLHKAEAGQENALKRLKTQLKKKSTALTAISPKHKGNFYHGEIIPLILGSKHGQVNVDFSSLVEELGEELTGFKEALVDEVINAVDQMIVASGVAGASAVSATQLKDTFVEVHVLQDLEERCSLKKFFSTKPSGRSYVPKALQRDDFAGHLKTVVASSVAKAVHTTILSKHVALSEQTGVSASDVHNLIESKLEGARKAWKMNAEGDLQTLLDEQFKLLLSDVVGWEGKKKKTGLLKTLLKAFLQHVVQTSAYQTDTTAQAEARQYVLSAREGTNGLHSLLTRSIKQNDPTVYGKAASRHFEFAIFLMQSHSTASATVTCKGMLKRLMPTISGVLLPHVPLAEVIYHQGAHMFSLGDVSQVRTLSDQVRAEPLRLFKGQLSGYSDLFKAVAQLVWKRNVILTAVPNTGHADRHQWFSENALPKMAAQLRTWVVADMAHFYRKEARREEFQEITGETPHDYMTRLRGAYPGDVHCLWFLASTLKVHFRVWLPGRHILIISSSRQFNGGAAYNLMLTAEESMDSPKANGYEPQFYPMIDTRMVRKGTDMSEYVSTDDEHVQARKSARPASRDELEHCPEAQQAYYSRKAATILHSGAAAAAGAAASAEPGAPGLAGP